jgi:hypothetical protein
MKRAHLLDNPRGNKNNMFLLVNSHLSGVKTGEVLISQIFVTLCAAA